MEEIIFTNTFKENKKKPQPEVEEDVVLETKAHKAKKEKEPVAKVAAVKKKKEDFTSVDEEPSFWKDGRASKIVALFLLLFSFVLAVAIGSFLFTIEEDI